MPSKKRKNWEENGGTNTKDVAGLDVVVYQYLPYNLATYTHISERMTYAELFQAFDSPWHYIWNKNVKKVPPNLKGLVCLARGAIWCIIHAVGDHAVATKVFPLLGKTKVVVLSLWETGFYLQRIKKKDVRNSAAENSFVTMDPAGPDVIEPVSNETIPQRIKLKDPFVVEDDVKPKPWPLPDQVPVVYILDNPQYRKSAGTEKTFSVPLWPRTTKREEEDR